MKAALASPHKATSPSRSATAKCSAMAADVDKASFRGGCANSCFTQIVIVLYKRRWVKTDQAGDIHATRVVVCEAT